MWIIFQYNKIVLVCLYVIGFYIFKFYVCIYVSIDRKYKCIYYRASQYRCELYSNMGFREIHYLLKTRLSTPQQTHHKKYRYTYKERKNIQYLMVRMRNHSGGDTCNWSFETMPTCLAILRLWSNENDTSEGLVNKGSVNERGLLVWTME